MELKTKIKLEIRLYLSLSESEARALHDITRYGTDSFLKVFYESLGKHYLYKNEKGLRDLFEAVKDQIPKHFKQIDNIKAEVKKLA